jgi:hypothetical protein
MSNVNTTALIRSLQSINQFIEGKNIFSNGNDFVAMYKMNIQLLKQVGQERETLYYEKRIPKLPEIFPIEIDDLINHRDGTKQIRSFLGGGILKIADAVKRTKQSNGKAVEDVRPKLDIVKDVYINFISVLEKPGLEDLIERSNG